MWQPSAGLDMAKPALTGGYLPSPAVVTLTNDLSPLMPQDSCAKVCICPQMVCKKPLSCLSGDFVFSYILLDN